MYGSREARDAYSDPFNASHIQAQPTTTSYPQEPSALTFPPNMYPLTFPPNMYHPTNTVGGPLPYYSQRDSIPFEPPNDSHSVATMSLYHPKPNALPPYFPYDLN
ncbi:hypothetical protein HETIRDRAFT_412124 [Heterobasidion irregulare TC 32-1]|uniref:Uncharacterized protein n=1 Tax=Heterobasidion irregulare (strain TC 32-1) TaxID=747525 RepID=W4JQC0_HETIT|nr:uncharacterized protein HETIRDRAFT_412124 [Heterobasidion irregulare TC 32-1]ETW75733.1 hypothetical protein HETIRDRAFT_412124 [Heterobasidion irregulare TC 32-1]